MPHCTMAMALDLDFAAQPSWLLWLLLVVALGLLSFGGDRAVTGAARVADLLGVSKVIIGATIVSLGTTSAEFFVSVMAAFRGQGDLALGNAVGSVIADTALIFGLCCLLRTLPKDRFVLHRQGVVKLATGALLAVTLLLLALSHGGFVGVKIPRWVGAGYVLLLVGYMMLSVRWARQHPATARARVEMAAHEKGRSPGPARRWRRVLVQLAVMAFGLVVVIFGSKLLLGSVSVLCERYGVPRHVLAVTLVAFGTSLPELVTAIASILRGHPELLVGNVVGADILNVLFVVGCSAMAMPLDVSPSFYYMHVPVMLLATALMGIFIFTGRGNTFRRWQGVPLLGLYGGYYVLLLATRGQV